MHTALPRVLHAFERVHEPLLTVYNQVKTYARNPDLIQCSPTGRPTFGWTDQPTDRPTNRSTDRPIDRSTDRPTDRLPSLSSSLSFSISLPLLILLRYPRQPLPPLKQPTACWKKEINELPRSPNKSTIICVGVTEFVTKDCLSV